MLLSIAEIRSTGNVRLDSEADGLVSSMRSMGQIVPITVRQDDEGYVVVAGHRRLAAARELGWEQIEAYVIGEDSPSLALQIAENVAREDLKPFEYAQGVLALKTEVGMNQQEIADALGVDKRVVSELQKVARGSEGLNPVELNQLRWDELEIFGKVHDMPDEMRVDFVEKIEQAPGDVYWTVNDYVEQVAKWRWSQQKENKALIKALVDIGAFELTREETFGVQFLNNEQAPVHRGENCHAFYIRKMWTDDNRQSYGIDEFCVEPQNHREDEAKPELKEMAEHRPTETRGDAEQKHRQKIRRQNKALRKEAVLTFSGHPKMRDLTEMMYTALLAQNQPYKWQELGKTFGLTKPEDEFHFDWEQYLSDFSGKERLTQQLILAIGSWYLTLEPTYSQVPSELLLKMDALFGVVLEEETDEEE